MERRSLHWLTFILSVFLVIWLLESIFFFLQMTLCILLCGIKIILVTLQFIVANLIVFFGLKQPDLFSGNNHIKYEKSALNKAVAQKYLKKLLEYMKTEKPYLIPALTLFQLAEKINIPHYHLSQVLNTGLKQNFFDFINAYRIEESKKLLSVNGSDKKTVSEILYQTGFNSKSVFNAAFKKHTGMTPSRFREKQVSLCDPA